jgi:hypothetical protein
MKTCLDIVATDGFQVIKSSQSLTSHKDMDTTGLSRCGPNTILSKILSSNLKTTYYLALAPMHLLKYFINP